MKKILFVLFVSFLLLGCTQNQSQPQTPTNSSIDLLTINVTVSAPARAYFKSEIVEAKKGDSAFACFSKVAQMEFKNYSFGVYVFSVEGISESNSEGLYWQYYFNNALAPVGVDQFRVSQDGNLEWR